MPRRVLLVSTLLLLSPAAAGAQDVQRNAVPAGTSLTVPVDAHFAYVDLNRVATLTTEGKAAAARIQAFRNGKAAELDGRTKALQDLQGKLNSALLNSAAKTELQRQFDRARVEYQRMAQDADEAVQRMQDEAERGFTARLFPVVGQIAKEKSLWAVFSAETPILWHDPRIDISEEVAKRMDAAPAPAKP